MYVMELWDGETQGVTPEGGGGGPPHNGSLMIKLLVGSARWQVTFEGLPQIPTVAHFAGGT